METQKDVRDVKEGDREVKEFKRWKGGGRERERRERERERERER